MSHFRIEGSGCLFSENISEPVAIYVTFIKDPSNSPYVFLLSCVTGQGAFLMLHVKRIFAGNQGSDCDCYLDPDCMD